MNYDSGRDILNSIGNAMKQGEKQKLRAKKLTPRQFDTRICYVRVQLYKRRIRMKGGEQKNLRLGARVDDREETEEGNGKLRKSTRMQIPVQLN